MNIDILYRPSYSLGVIKLEPKETVQVESGAMVSYSAGVQMETRATGGLLKSLGRALLGNESFFQNTFTASAQGGEVSVAPVLPGDLFQMELQDDVMFIQSGSYVASGPGVEINTSWGGAKTFFASEGMIMLRGSGRGKLLISSYGAIHEVLLKEKESYTVDTGHLVGYSENMGFKVRSVGGVKSTIFSGEGLVVDLTGPGKVLLPFMADTQAATPKPKPGRE